jgi:hypothetical protein
VEQPTDPSEGRNVTRARYRPISGRVEVFEVWISSTVDFQVRTGRQEDDGRLASLLRGNPGRRTVRGRARRRDGGRWLLIESRTGLEPRAPLPDGGRWRDDPRGLKQHRSRRHCRSADRGLDPDPGVCGSRYATATSHADSVAVPTAAGWWAPVLASDSRCATTGHGRRPTCSSLPAPLCWRWLI